MPTVVQGKGAQATEPAHPVVEAVTLVEGSTFAISGRLGDMNPDSAQGLFFSDTRIVSGWQLRIDAHPPEYLAVMTGDPFRATFLTRVAPRGSQTELLLERHRFVGQGMREDLVLRNLSHHSLSAIVSLTAEADFADLFTVKDGRARTRGELTITAEGDALCVALRDGRSQRGVRISAAGARATRTALRFEVSLPARGEWTTSVLVTPSIDGVEVTTSFPIDLPIAESRPALAMSRWRGAGLHVDTDNAELQNTLGRSVEDLGALRIAHPDHPDEVAVAAGAPWFMALFGRDSLLSSYLALLMDPGLAVGTLRALARNQGTRVNPSTEEQPGRILHETRLGLDFPLVQGGGSAYYGSADATPLFVVLLGELQRWGNCPRDVEALIPYADRALDWITSYGDRDGDGFVEYESMSDQGLVNQGWKDSHDGVNFADGTLAATPIALCEVQGYVYAAYLARAEIARASGDSPTADRWAGAATGLKRAFNDRFWLPDLGWYALGLDRDKTPIDALASNMGHCLWSGIVDVDKAPLVAERLMSPEMFTGWGIRTLASSMAAYNPMSYHNGSVWPHDSTLVAAGLMRYGFVDAAQRLAGAILEAAACFDGRLPELMCGFDRTQYPQPVAYPTSCSPQAWASASPLHLIRMLLRLDPSMAQRRVRLDSAWPEQYGSLTIDELEIGGASASLYVDGGRTRISGLPEGVTVGTQPPPLG